MTALMRLKTILLAAAFMLQCTRFASASGVPSLIVGDSLSKEYSVEGPLLWNNLLPLDAADFKNAIKARNWMEILIALRGSQFNFGSYGTRADSRAPAGHAHNWAVPGSMTSEWQGALNGASVLDQFILTSFDADLRNGIGRVVIFLGGNDLNNNYNAYYNGADPTAFVNSLLSNYASIVQHVKSVNATAQIVICTAPDVGATPSVQSGHTDPVKRALMTSLTESLNTGIARLATNQGLGLADIDAFTQEYMTSGTISIGRIPLIKGTDKGNYPTYIFSEDGFHPNTCAQALIANRIIGAFNDKFNAGIDPLSDLEIIKYLESEHGVKLPEPPPTPVPALSGTVDQTFTGANPVWQIAGEFSGDIGQNLALDIILNEEPSGKLTGNGVLSSDDHNGNQLSGGALATGAIKSSGTTASVTLTVVVSSGSGTISTGQPAVIHPASFSRTVKLTAEIDGATRTLNVKSGSVSTKAKDQQTGAKITSSAKIKSGADLPLPASATSNWELTAILAPGGIKYSGTAILQSPPGATATMAMSGSFSPGANTAKLSFKGAAGSLSAVVSTTGSNLILHSATGKLFGQNVKYKGP